MVSIPLRVFIHGLIALIPTTDPVGTKMTALLVDGRTSSTTECAMDHHPKLQFLTNDTASCAAAGCESLPSGECLCRYDPAAGFPRVVDPLVGKKIWLEINPAPTLASANPPSVLPDRALPEDSREAARFSYVANLGREPFDLAIDPKYTSPQDSFDHLVTRVEVPYKDMSACSLATRLDGGQANIHALSFRELGVKPDSGEIGYALAQMIVTELTVPDAGSGVQQVILHISDQTGGDIPIQLFPGQDPNGNPQFEIEISNSPAQDLPFDSPCDDGVARHFLHFFQLAQQAPAKQLIPHVRFTQFKSQVPLEPAACKKRTFAMSSRPICPMATFNP